MQGDVYNRLTFKKIQTWKELRDQAAHGNFSEYGDDDVEDVMKGVTSFLEQYL